MVCCILMMCLVGCSSGSSSRQFNLGFDQAEPKLRKMYPPILVRQPNNAALLNITESQHAKFVGPIVTVKRDEVFEAEKVRIVIEEGQESRNRRTEILLTAGPGANDCNVEVVASKSKSNVVFPARDKEFESAVLEDISAALK